MNEVIDDVNVDTFVKCSIAAFHDLASTLFWWKIFLKMLSIRICMNVQIFEVMFIHNVC